MTVPAAVERQAEEAEQAFAEFEKELGLESAAPAPEAGEPTPTPPAAAPAPSAPPANPPAEGDRLTALERQLEYERHRNDSLQGRLDSQLRAANQELKQLREQLSRAPAGPVVPPAKRHLKPEELANLDENAVDLQSRVARGVAEETAESVRQELERKNAELAERLAALEQSRQAEAVDTLWDAVEKIAPGAKAINESDPGWFRFLDGVDDISGRLRRDIGAAAATVGDVKRLASLIEEYRAASGVQAPRPAVASQVRPPVAPAAAPAAPKKPVFKESQVKRFYDNWNRGAYKGKEKEAEELERQIDAAAQEGRIIAG